MPSCGTKKTLREVLEEDVRAEAELPFPRAAHVAPRKDKKKSRSPGHSSFPDVRR